MKTYEEYGIRYEYKRSTAIECAKEKIRPKSKSAKGAYAFRPEVQTFESKAKLEEAIAAKCFVDSETARNWLRSNHGSNPASIDLVHKLEEFFGKPQGFLLNPISIIQEERKVNMTIKLNEYESAKALYISLLETIEAAIPRWPDFVRSGGAVRQLNSMDDRRYNMLLEIRKTGMDLPKSLRDSAMMLIDKIYGPESDEPDAFFSTPEFTEYVSTDEYKKYIEENWPEGRNIDMDRYNYCEYVRDACYAFLDEIFSAFMCL